MATTPYDPLKDVAPELQPRQQSGIVSSLMQPAAAPSPAAPKSSAIVGAQSQQLETPTQWNVTDDQTVEGRINRIINADSPLMQQSKSRSLEAANARGLANTSMAVTAGESALYDAALPIAQSDAATAAKAAGYNADQSNQFAVHNADAENQFKLTDKQNDQQTRMSNLDTLRQTQLSNLDAVRQKELAEINRETQVQLSNLDAVNKTKADAIAAQNQRVLETNAQANSSFQTAVSAVNNLQNNPNLDAASKTTAIAQVWRDLQTQMGVLQQVSGLDLTSKLNFANYPGFSGTGEFVGFDAAGNTSGAAATGGTGTSAPTQFPTTIGGVRLDWDAKIMGGGTLRNLYQSYAQSAGAAAQSPEQWYASRFINGALPEQA